jgi:hypothetical protein
MMYAETNMMNMFRYIPSFGNLKIAPALFLSRERNFSCTFECSYCLGVDCEISEATI